MKKIALFLIVALLFSCKENKSSNDTHSTTEKETVTTTNTEEQEEEILIGKISCKNMETPPFNDWFVENFNDHTLDSTTISQLKPVLNDVRIKVFMGTWCSDSQREVPALYKVLEAAEFDENNMEIIAVDRDKVTPSGLEKGMDIQYVPTIIFYKEGKEIGRFVESAVESLEKDMLAIVTQSGYKHAYQE